MNRMPRRLMTAMPPRRGFHLRPLLDEDGEPTTRAALAQQERGDANEYEAERVWRVPIDPALVGVVARLQRASGGGCDG